MNCIASSPDGSFLFGGGKSGKIYVWALGSGALLTVFEAHYREVTTLTTSSDGACLVSGGDDGIVHCWWLSSIVDTSSSPVPCNTFTNHGLRITCVRCCLGPYGQTMVLSASLDCTVKIFSLSKGELVSDVVFPKAITSVTMDAMEKRIFAGSVEGPIYCLDLKETGISKNMSHEQRILSCHAGEITSLVCVSNGHREILLSSSLDGKVVQWDVVSNQIVASFNKHSSGVTSCCAVLMDPNLGFQEKKKRALVGKIQKYVRTATNREVPVESALFWHTFAPSIKEEKQDRIVNDSMDASNGAKEFEASTKRIAELENEVRRLSEKNKKLYEGEIDKVLESTKKKPKSSKKKKNDRYFE